MKQFQCSLQTLSGTILFLLVSLPFLVSGQGSWEKLEVPVQVSLNSVSVVDSMYGWVAGDSGTILHTNNGGDSWIHQQSQTNHNIQKIFFIDRDTGWASAFNFIQAPFGTELLSTVNGGDDWEKTTYPEENVFMNALYYFNSFEGWMGGLPHSLVSTSNGGINWVQTQIDTTPLSFFPVLNINFYNKTYGYACGGLHDIAGVIWYTSNGGESWGSIDPGFAPADEIYQVYPFDSLHALAVGGDPDFAYGFSTLRTYDGGETWNYDEPGIQGNAFDVDVVNGSEVWCPMGWQRTLLYSADTGYTWNILTTPDSTEIFDIEFSENEHGLGVGRQGAVIRYIPPTGVGVEEDIYHPVWQDLILQNFPNPFSLKTRIHFIVPDPVYLDLQQTGGRFQEIRITLYDGTGNLRCIILEKEYPPGEHSVSFQSIELPSGIYHCMLQTKTGGNQWRVAATKKMILLK